MSKTEPKIELDGNSGCFVSRNTELISPEGFRTMLVFGVVVVPDNSALKANTMFNAATSRAGSQLTLYESPTDLSSIAAWNVGDTLEELFGVTGGREPSAMETCNRALALISEKQMRTKEFVDLIPQLKNVRDSLPVFDTMRQVIDAVLRSGGIDG